MTDRTVPEKFLVAFSFAGEERELVRAIAEEVERQLGTSTVFLDEWFEYYIAGDDSDLRLQKIYGDRCEMVVVGVSETYGTKPWTLAEHAAVRARSMKLRASNLDSDKHRILPIRVGDGDVAGILFNSIAPEARGKPISKTAALIVNKLHLVLPKAKIGDVGSHQSWPKEPVPFSHGLADRTECEWPAVLNLLTLDSDKRILMFEGPSGHSKSALLGVAAKYAKVLQVPAVYVDFKDTTLLNEKNVLREIQLGLRHALPSFATDTEPDRWKLGVALASLQGPALILLDTYEKAAETKDLVDWIETRLLVEVEECLPLRFIIGGQKVPNLEKARWRDRAQAVELTGIHDKQVWKDWVKRMNPNVDGESIDAFVDGFNGVPANISSTLTVLARHVKQPV
jgi:hypothetical protein